jgi:regulator of sigma D
MCQPHHVQAYLSAGYHVTPFNGDTQMRELEAKNEMKEIKKIWPLRSIKSQAQIFPEYSDRQARRVLYPTLVPDWELPLDT